MLNEALTYEAERKFCARAKSSIQEKNSISVMTQNAVLCDIEKAFAKSLDQITNLTSPKFVEYLLSDYLKKLIENNQLSA